MSRFDFEDPIFESQEPLTDHHDPETLHNREQELEALARSLSWVVRDEPPKNVLVKGGKGTGKSEAVDQILRELHSEVTDSSNTNLTSIKIQCRNHPTEYQLSIDIINKLRAERNDGEAMSRTGHSGGAVQEALFDEFEVVGGTILIVLDEIDSIESDELDDLLYSLSRVGTQGRVSGCKLAFLGIANNSNFGGDLNVETKDSLTIRQIIFDDYDSKDLIEILESRAEKAFQEGVYDEKTLRISASSAKIHSGSARYAIDLLFKAGEIARQKDENAINQEIIEIANGRLQGEHLVESIKAMSFQSVIVLATISLMQDNNELPAGLNKIYPFYCEVIDEMEDYKRSKRRMKDRVDDLVHRGFLDSSSGGYIEYRLDVEKTPIIEAMEKYGRQSLQDWADEMKE